MIIAAEKAPRFLEWRVKAKIRCDVILLDMAGYERLVNVAIFEELRKTRQPESVN